MRKLQQWRGRGEDHRRVGGVLVVTDAQRAALTRMAPTLGSALARASRIERLSCLLASEVEGAAKRIDAHNATDFIREAGAQLDALADSPLGDGIDFKVLVLRDLARRIGCDLPPSAELPPQPANLELHHLVDRARGAAMQVLASYLRVP